VSRAGGQRPIIVRREEVVEGGHHGGAWKVAYADFVTAMMAFFLLMWLLNATTDEQRRGLADYFSPMNPLARGASGTGQPFGGKTPFETGEMVSDRGTMSIMVGRVNEPPAADEAMMETSQPHQLTQPNDEEAASGGESRRERTKPGATATGQDGTAANQASDKMDQTLRISPDARVLALVGNRTTASAAIELRAAIDDAALRAEQGRREGVAFERAAEQIRDAIRGDKLLEDLSRQLAIDVTPEGLRIQLLDEDRKPMFALGSTVMNDRARQLLQKMTPALLKLSEPIAISGHTDATPFRSGDKGNWELSSERANVTRRILVEAGLQETRIRSVTGNADRDLLLPADPLAAANRRIAIVVLRTAGKPSTPTPRAVP
jgi:chemotaxis protein MotB